MISVNGCKKKYTSDTAHKAQKPLLFSLAQILLSNAQMCLYVQTWKQPVRPLSQSLLSAVWVSEVGLLSALWKSSCRQAETLSSPLPSYSLYIHAHLYSQASKLVLQMLVIIEPYSGIFQECAGVQKQPQPTQVLSLEKQTLSEEGEGL